MKFQRLDKFIASHYAADSAPEPEVARRWCREGWLQPVATKQGRHYFIDIDNLPTGNSLVDKVLYGAKA